MNLFSSPWELYSHPFSSKFFSILRNISYPRIKFSKLVTNIDIYEFMILFQRIFNYNLKQTFKPGAYKIRHGLLSHPNI